MRIALISYYKVSDYKKYISPRCTEILTNVPDLEEHIPSIPIIYKADIDELIKNADWVTVICGKSLRGSSTVISKCRKYHVTAEVVNIDTLY